MKRLFVLLFIIFGFCIVSSSNANAAYCIKKKDDGKWPFYLGSTYDSKCPRKFKKVSKYEYEKFKKVIDEKYVPKGIVSTSPKKATNIKSSWNGTYTWRGQKVSKDVYCTNADKNKMRVYHPEEFELKCSDYGKLTFRETKKKEAEANKIKTQSSNTWITKKNNKFDKITEIENMYSEGYLTKSECEKAKSKILNTNEKGMTNCDNIKVYTVKNNNSNNNSSNSIQSLNIDGQYSYASNFLKIGDYKKAEIYFREFVLNNPNHPRAANAQYWYAETFRIREMWTDAAQAYLEGYQKYPNSDIAPENLLKLGASLVEMGEKDQGCLMIAGVQRQYPNAEYSVLMKAKYYAESQYNCDQKIVIANKDKEKKIEITKIEEPNIEEFKPKTKDIDNDAPIIEIAENITVDSQTYTLKGKVKDKSKLYIEANGRPLKLKKGSFQIEGFIVDPDAGEEIKLVAIDQWKNKSEKTINIKVKFKELADKKIYEIPNPSKIKVKKDRNKIAIIIGIEKYRSLENIDAPYANRDANAFRAYANKALGIPNENIKVLIDEDATRAETLKALSLWLPQAARGKGKDIYVFFAGHGLASDDGKNLYILPQDGDAALLEYTAISRLEMFEFINKVEPNSVTMFFDTCYSGQSRDERMLVAGLRPIRLLESEQEKPINFTIFTASNYDQTSGSIEEAKHGIFSYYLMKGMEGKADANEDKKISNGELISYLKENVSDEAFINNRQQEPMLSGDPDKILITFN